MDSNYYGALNMIRAFAPILARNGGGAILNVLSVAAWMTVDGNTSYAAAKSAEWGLTNGVRVELAAQGTQVSALIPGLIATQTLLDFAAQAGVELPADAMSDPADLARQALDGLEAGEIEILDQLGVDAKAALSGPPVAFAL
jgi:short-subunit dehydrogenase